MTVSTTLNSVTYQGNGAATSFAVPFKVLDEDHLVVKRRIAATHADDHTYIGTDYSYSGIGDDAGTLTLDGTALSSTYEIYIERIVPYTQALDIVNAGGFYPETVEEQLDLTTMQIQQIGAQSDDIETRALMVPVGEEAPTYADFAETFRGVPGGNVESLGLFSTLSLAAPDIGAGTDSVRTSGYSVVGSGSANYVYSAAVDAAYVIANPRTSFLAESGRGFRLSLEQVITPKMFGAIELAESTVELQAFFDFIEVNRVLANWQGKYYVSAGIVGGGNVTGIDQHLGNGVTIVTGHLSLKVTTTILGPVFHNKFGRGFMFDTINIGPLVEELPWADRLFDVGIFFEDQAQMQCWGGFYIAFAKVAAIFIQGVAPNNTFGNHFQQGYLYGCGSGYEGGAGTGHQSSTYSARAFGGVAEALDQTTVFTVATLPPAFVSDQSVVAFVLYDGRVYPIDTINTGASTVTVRGWIESTAPASGTLHYIYGGGISARGGDAGVMSGRMAITTCAIGLTNAPLYPGHYTLTMQHNAIGLVVGTGPSGASVGGTAIGYWESNDLDIFWNAASGSHGFTVIAEQALSLRKIEWMRPRRADDSLTEYNKPRRLLINRRGHWLNFEKDCLTTDNAVFDRVDVYMDQPYGETLFLHHDNPLIRLITSADDVGTDDTDFQRLFGYTARAVDITGSGANGEATGTVTVSHDLFPGTTLNGGAPNVTFAGLTRPVRVIIRRDPATATNYLVHLMTGA